MAGPTEEAPAAAVSSPKSGVSEERASTAAAARPRGFWPFGEDKSVHKVLGGGKSMNFSELSPTRCLLISVGILRSSFCALQYDL
jgi:hypothetical protein